MNNKESNKQNKKKIFVLFLLLFVVIGLTGYGAYSYFWTSGSFSGSDTVDIESFDPQLSLSGDFLGNGGTMTLTCPDSDDGYESITCTGSLEVYNNGGTDIVVSISDDDASASAYSSSDNVTASAGTPTFTWTDTTISPSSSETLTVEVPVELTSEFGSSSSYERNSAYSGEAVEVTVSFKITAAQVH